MSGDAADEVVRIMLNGTEVAVRLAGSGVKNLAAMLIAWSKKEKKPYGKTNMMRLLKSGEELQVISLDKEQYKQFKALAKKKVLYAPFLNTKEEDGKIEVVISSKSIPLVNFILKKIGYGDVQQDESADLSKKNKVLRRKKARPSLRPDPRRWPSKGQPSGAAARNLSPSLRNWRRTVSSLSKRTRSSPERTGVRPRRRIAQDDQGQRCA